MLETSRPLKPLERTRTEWDPTSGMCSALASGGDLRETASGKKLLLLLLSRRSFLSGCRLTPGRLCFIKHGKH
ncbi:hypothetical protein EYF80_021544 [Liparis tanakae]|uniref:Uncharacterized protein n=1 Tax=Liparis tanakae TaxID=230148 RepID=A0A4Z2HTM5_9TELE|nr:hypothetical protein EYF80_021544 [Liparis tanakae]